MARSVAESLVEADLLGHATHGLALLADYVEEIDNGTMAPSGEAEKSIVLDYAKALRELFDLDPATAESVARPSGSTS